LETVLVQRLLEHLAQRVDRIDARQSAEARDENRSF
jgi:hypothetical protein